MVTPYTPTTGMRLMGAMLNPTVENASFPPALLDWGAVIPGRCTAAWQRDPLEFQERLFDEVAVSMFWLWGANWMDTLFSQLQKALPSLKHIRSDVGMGIYNGDSLIKNGLTPLERFSKNHTQALRMQGVRSGKTLLSVVTNFLIIALLIPRLNQLKTAWLVKHFYKQPQPATAKPTDLRLGNQSALVQQATHAEQAFHYLNAEKALNPAKHAPLKSSAPTFGGSGVANGVKSALKALEVVKSTDYGYILTGDGAMLAGRSYSAFTRPDVSRKDTVGEVREILWRDAVSSYLYLWGIPHMTKLASAVIQPFWRSTTHLEPMVGQMVLSQLAPLLNQQKTPVTRQQLATWWKGQPISQAVHDEWRTALTRVHQAEPFWERLALDIRHTMGSTTWQQHRKKLVFSAPQTITADTLGPWLDTVQKTASLGPDVVRSIKRAYAHAVGLPLTVAQDTLLPLLPQADKAAASQRMRQLAIQQTKRQLADVWQFAIQHLPSGMPLKTLGWPHEAMDTTALGKQLDAMANTFDHSFSKHFTELPKLLNALAKANPATSSPHSPLFKRLAQDSQQLLTQPVLHQLEAALPWDTITHLITGAAQHNPQLIQQAMQLVGIAPADYRQEVHPGKLKKLLANMDAFWSYMVQHVPADALSQGNQAMAALNSLAKTRNMWPRYVTLAAGVLGSMISLGILVPKIQYWITQKTTGRNEQPALAALKQRYGLAR
jgi:hypothetical protein